MVKCTRGEEMTRTSDSSNSFDSNSTCNNRSMSNGCQLMSQLMSHLSGSQRCAIKLRSGLRPSGNFTPHRFSTSSTNRSEEA